LSFQSHGVASAAIHDLLDGNGKRLKVASVGADSIGLVRRAFIANGYWSIASRLVTLGDDIVATVYGNLTSCGGKSRTAI